jgi:hypothetical protein
MEQNERAYWTKDVANKLQIGHSTLRKYCLCLEEHGYHFTKGQRGVRAFLERDIEVLAKMKDVLNETGTTLEEAVSVALEEREDDPLHVALSPEQSSVEQENWRLHVATSFQMAQQLLEQQKEELLVVLREEVREEVREALREQEIRVIEREEERENRTIEREKERTSKRDEQLMEIIRIQQETKMMVATSKEKKWYQFWK